MINMTKENLSQVAIYLSKKLREPSSHAALSAMLVNFGFVLGPGTGETLCFVLSGLFAAAGFFLNEKGTPVDSGTL